MRGRFRKKTPVIAAVSLIIILSVVLVLRTGLLNTKTILIEGDHSLFEKPFTAKIDSPLILLDTNELVEEVKSISPWIKNVHAIKKYPWTLVIKVTERTPVATFTKDEVQYLISEDGMVLPIRGGNNLVPAVKLDCVVDQSPGQLIDKSQIFTGLAVIKSLTQNQDVMIESLLCVNDDRYQITTSKTIIEYGRQNDSETIVSSLQVLFRQFRIEGTWPKRVDLRFDKPLLVMEEYVPSTESAMPVE